MLGNGESRSENALEGRTIDAQYTGEAVIYTVQVGGVDIRVKAHHSLEIEDGAQVVVDLPTRHCTAVRPMSAEGSALDDEDVGIASVFSGEPERAG